MKAHQWIAVLDFGSQYSQLIARRVREQGVYSKILPCITPAKTLREEAPTGIILSGGPASVFEPGAPACEAGLFQMGIPILGICYGMQTLARALGGSVKPGAVREYGLANISIHNHNSLFRDLPSSLTVWMSHGDRVEKLPPGFESIASSNDCPIAAMAHPSKRFFGLQFHPEVSHTPKGNIILKRFLFDVCGCRGDWRMGQFIDDAVHSIRETVGDEHVVCGLSGGVDSTVVAVLIHKAIGDHLHCIMVDNGVLRFNEADEVENTLRDGFNMNLKLVDARDLFLGRLKGVIDPEEKRKIIGKTFIEVFGEEARAVGKVRYLAQGTLYPDVIESLSPIGGPSATIKSHHNVGGLPENMAFDLIEPVRELFKDEVRVLGRELGLPEHIVNRQPFPGPGLAVRIVGEVTPERVALLQKADLRLQEEISKLPTFHQLWQSFVVLLPVQSVGVMGDSRTYENVVALRIVESVDGMTADWSRIPYEVLGRISSRIINEVRGVNRVVYDISSKPPATIEWE